MSDIQLTSAKGYNVNNIIFSKPQAGGLKDTSVKFRRIYLSTKHFKIMHTVNVTKNRITNTVMFFLNGKQEIGRAHV
jgi:hypothetical protein